jgi:hypothetical protein
MFTLSRSAIDDIASLLLSPFTSVRTEGGLLLVAKRRHKTAKVGEALKPSSQLLASTVLLRRCIGLMTWEAKTRWLIACFQARWNDHTRRQEVVRLDGRTTRNEGY